MELQKKIDMAIRLIQSAGANGQIVEVSYSGGKDSDVILELTRMAGIKYRAIYKNTTIDPPGTIKHCREKGVEVVRKKSFAQVIRERGLPTFKRRFCCEELKEYKILERSIQGIRRSESIRRSKLYKEPTMCRLYKRTKEHVEVFFPILEWSDKDIADFVYRYNLKCHPLYYNENGDFDPKKRLGCLGCPLKSDKGLNDFKKYPRIVKLWLRNGDIWFNSHKLEKTKVKYNDIYEIFVCNVFFRSYEGFQSAINDMFGEVDCKRFLMEYFNIDL